MGKQLRGNQQQKQKTILYICGVHCPFHRIQVNRALFYGLTKYTIITLNAAHTLFKRINVFLSAFFSSIRIYALWKIMISCCLLLLKLYLICLSEKKCTLFQYVR